MDMNRKWTMLGTLVLAAAVGAGWWIMAGRTAADNAPAPASASTAKASTAPVLPSSGPANDSLRYPPGSPQLAMIHAEPLHLSAVPLGEPLSARLAYDEDATARVSVAVAGRIVALKVAPGDRVTNGQVLAEIDAPDFGTALADLQKARADETRKKLVLDRAQALQPGEAIAAKEVEAAHADLLQAQAETARADQRLKNLNPRGLPVQGQRIVLTSPLDGVVTERNANPGLEVAPGMAVPLFVVSDPRRLWLLIDLPEKLIPRVRLGSTVAVESDAYAGERFNAKIVQLGQVLDPNTRRAIVRAKLDNTAGRLLPEMYVRALLPADSGQGVAVPNSALVNRGLYTYVFVQAADGSFKRREVKLLTRGSETSFVGEGLKDGEDVVVTGALLLDAEISSRAEAKS
jgi:cobalt-zinc-cadmium efflux system membrane fusion protein